MAKQVAKGSLEPVAVERTKLHVLQLWFGWFVVILALLNIFRFENARFLVDINTLNLSILLLGILEVVSGRRR